jgi:hypothetical protein
MQRFPWGSLTRPVFILVLEPQQAQSRRYVEREADLMDNGSIFPFAHRLLVVRVALDHALRWAMVPRLSAWLSAISYWSGFELIRPGAVTAVGNGIHAKELEKREKR